MIEIRIDESDLDSILGIRLVFGTRTTLMESMDEDWNIRCQLYAQMLGWA